MASEYSLPYRARWIQEDMQETLNRIISSQQEITDASLVLFQHVEDTYSADTKLWSIMTKLSLYHQQLNIQISLLQQMTHDLKTGNYKERDKNGHTISPE